MTDEILYRGQYLTMVRRNNWEFVKRTGSGAAVIIFPLLMREDGPHLIFIREYRVPLGKNNISVPAGILGDYNKKEEAIEAARRELLEETGYFSHNLKFLMKGVPSAGLTDEMLYFFMAYDLIKQSNNTGVDGEDITPFEVPLNKAEEWIEKQTDMVDPKCYMAIYFARRFLEEQ